MSLRFDVVSLSEISRKGTARMTVHSLLKAKHSEVPRDNPEGSRTLDA